MHTTQGTDPVHIGDGQTYAQQEPTGTDTAGHADTHTATVTQDTDPVVTKTGTVLAYATVGTDSLVPRSGTSSASSPQVKVRSLT